MKCHRLQFTKPGQVEVNEEPVPQPAANEVLVQTNYSAISPGTEMLVYRGQWPEGVATDSTIDVLAGSFSYPLTYGYCAVGKVVKAGAAISEQWLGRRVFAFRPHSSCFCTSLDSLFPLKDDLDDQTALLLPSMETAVNLLLDGRPLIGENIIVIGQGIIGLLTTALLSKFPLSSLNTIDSYPLRREASIQMGADNSYDAGSPSLITDLGGKVGSGGNADLVYELSGNPSALDTAVSLSRFSGRVVIGSWYGNKKAVLDLGSFFHRGRVDLISSQVSSLQPDLTGRWDTSRRLQQAAEMLTQYDLTGVITHRFSLDNAAQAYALINRNPGETIQVIFTYHKTTSSNIETRSNNV